jgi:magnesium-protoporphyrin O-methyltransferase
MATATYDIRRGELTTYFDRTAADAWEALTSDAPVSKIRATVRAGRDRMRALLLSRLPADMTGLTLLDAGCGTGALAMEAARRGAKVTAIDVSPRMIAIANERLGDVALAGGITFLAGDMLDPVLGSFDHVVAMDSLIHYARGDVLRALDVLAPRTRRSILFTVAPRTPLLSAMHTAGKLFPRSDRSPAIQPIAPAGLARAIASEPALTKWRLTMSERISSGFYMSQAQELVRR